MKTNHIFPWWAGYFLLNPLRKRRLDPCALLGPHVKAGMAILDAGCAMGFFSLPLAQMTGPAGRVFCVDPQQRMLDVLAKRAAKKGLSDIIVVRPCTFTSLRVDDLAGRIDLALVFGVLHEVRDKKAFIYDIATTLKPGGRFIFGEPHVLSQSEFDEELDMMAEKGFIIEGKDRKGDNKIAVMHKKSWSEGHQSCRRAIQAG
ncbi:MAG: class I SAM-dependent methyltransferase [Deltaproteobacteria bacterium]|nr:class I SAM-dependent methyltransferase [Deltaproteobacteria bacterium]